MIDIYLSIIFRADIEERRTIGSLKDIPACIKKFALKHKTSEKFVVWYESAFTQDMPDKN